MELLWHSLLLIGVGMLSGFLNVIAGGGSLITLPILIMFLGLPAAVANGTNRLSIISQNVSAVKKFKDKGFFDLKLNILLSATSIPGAIAGTLSAVNIKDALFNKILAVIMIMVMISTFIGNIKRSNTSDTAKHPVWLAISFFFIGFYGGFVQAGVGFIIIAALTLIGQLSLVRTNSVKVFVVLIFTIPSLIIFILSGKVHWVYGIALAIGNGIGGWFGSHFSVTKGDKWIRVFLAVTVTAMAVKLLL